MTPYKIPGTSKWVDLEHVVEITEPTGAYIHPPKIFYTLMFIGECWASIEDLDIYWVSSSGDKSDYERREEETELVKERVFKPFFEAWTESKG